MIVGTNASGKSNLRDAFRFIHGIGRGYSLAEIIGEKYVESGVLQWKGIRGGVREVAMAGEADFRVETSLKYSDLTGIRSEYSIQVGLSDVGSGPRVLSESLKEASDFVFDAKVAASDPKAEETAYIHVTVPTDAEPQLPKLKYGVHHPVVSQLWYDRKREFSHLTHPNKLDVVRASADIALDSMRDMRFLDLSPEAMKAPSVPGQVILGDRGENLSSVLQAICEDVDQKKAISEWIRELTPIDVVDFKFIADQTGRVLLNLIEANGQQTSAYSASDGTLRFLAIIAALMGPDPANCYFIEEIETGLHPSRLYLLLQLIEQQTKQAGIQVVATSHSPQLLGMLSEESREHASLVYRTEGEREAHICRIMDIPDARRVLESRNLSRLHESGWLEDAMAFAQTTDE